jgi:hypothetical protein
VTVRSVVRRDDTSYRARDRLGAARKNRWLHVGGGVDPIPAETGVFPIYR